MSNDGKSWYEKVGDVLQQLIASFKSENVSVCSIVTLKVITTYLA